jgi:hypothetical protein
MFSCPKTDSSDKFQRKYPVGLRDQNPGEAASSGKLILTICQPQKPSRGSKVKTVYLQSRQYVVMSFCADAHGLSVCSLT